MWGLVVLRAWRRPDDDPFVGRCLVLLVAGASALALIQVVVLVLKAVVLSDYLGRTPGADLLGTLQFRAGLGRAALAVTLAVAAARLRHRSSEVRGWIIVTLLASALGAGGAWLVHATGRLEHRLPLMVLTAMHQAGAAVWVGGVIQLVAAWRYARSRPALASQWAELVPHFSQIGIACVLLLLATAAPLVWEYVGSWSGLVGTGYGSLVLTKAALMGSALLLATLNFTAARRWRRRRNGASLSAGVPYFIEAESVLLVILLFAAASLSSQPPAVDTVDEQASWTEVAEVFRPKWPALRTPSVETMTQIESDPLAVVGWERTNASYSWSNFSHNVAGLFLLGMALLAFVPRGRYATWARHWPLGLVALGLFVSARAAANEGAWPFGPNALWRAIVDDPEVLQHQLGAALAIALGLIEWRARTTTTPATRLPYVFPVLATLGGLFLLTHSHSAFEVKSSYLIQITHTAMGALAVLLACTRWLELRLAPPASRVAGAASTTAMLLIALVLVFYREANVILPPEP
ncbi:MAG: copper resistance D family protein [Candidatus Binatia bacterium]